MMQEWRGEFWKISVSAANQQQSTREINALVYTDGTLYQRGVPIARAICLALYGRVLPRED